MKFICCALISFGWLSKIPPGQAEVEMHLNFPRLTKGDTSRTSSSAKRVKEEIKSEPTLKTETSIPPDTDELSVPGNLMNPSQHGNLPSNNGQTPNRLQYYLESQFLSLPGMWESSPITGPRPSSATSQFFSTPFTIHFPFSFSNFGTQQLPSSANENVETQTAIKLNEVMNNNKNQNQIGLLQFLRKWRPRTSKPSTT